MYIALEPQFNVFVYSMKFFCINDNMITYNEGRVMSEQILN